MQKEKKPSEIIQEFLEFLKYCDKEYKDCVTQVYKYDKMNQDYLHDMEDNKNIDTQGQQNPEPENQPDEKEPTVEELMAQLAQERAEKAKLKNNFDKTSSELASTKKQLKAKQTAEEQEEEAKAYQELTTYAGTTIVENDADCYMEVSAGGGDVLRAKKLALLLGRLIIGRVLLLLYNCSGRRKKT